MDKLKRLEKIVERNSDEREAEKLKHERQTGRLREIAEAPERQATDFWCRKCRLDFQALGHKLTASWPEPKAWYETKCPDCGTTAIRRITDRLMDPYFNQSVRIRKMRREAGDDLLQPGDPRFEKVWGWKLRQQQNQ